MRTFAFIILPALRRCSGTGVTVCSICNGAFALGEAGLLKNTGCTTHWKRVKSLQQQFPDPKVIADILYIKSNNHILLRCMKYRIT